MEKIKSDALKTILKENRNRLNSLYAFAKHQNINLDERKFLESLKYILELLFSQSENTDQMSESVLFIYERILELWSKNILGNRGKYPHFEIAFYEIIKAFSHQILIHPELFSALVNALLKFEAEQKENTILWKECMVSFAKLKIDSKEKIYELGYLASWVNGMAHYRTNALTLLDSLSLDEFQILFKMKEAFDKNEMQKMIENIKSNPWYHPGKKQSNHFLKKLGGFRGFGNGFERPPVVFTLNHQLFAFDQKQVFEIYADVFGTRFIKSHLKYPKDFSKSKTPFLFNDLGNIEYDEKIIELDQKFFFSIHSSIYENQTFCFTSANSYKVFILGLPGEGNEPS